MHQTIHKNDQSYRIINSMEQNEMSFQFDTKNNKCKIISILIELVKIL